MSDTEIETIDLVFSELSSVRDTGHRLSFLPLRVQDKRRTKQSQTGKRSTKRSDKRSQTQHTTHTNTNIIYFFPLEVGMDWGGVKPGLGWLNGITHDIFLDFFDELILFCLVNLSYVSNENVWKRIRAGLFGLTFWI